MSLTIRDPSTQSVSDPADPHRYRRQAVAGTIEVEETSGVTFAEVTGRAGRTIRPSPRPSAPWRARGVSLTLAVLAGGAIAWLWPRRPGAARSADDGPAPRSGAAASLEAMVSRAISLIGDTPRRDDADGRQRSEAERLRQVIDAQDVLLREGEAAPLSEPIPDAVPMTGEEDPIVEIENPAFADSVAAFMRSERDASIPHGGTARARLARALLPFADAACDPAAVASAIEAPLADFSATLAAGQPGQFHAADIQLVETLSRIAERARVGGEPQPLEDEETRHAAQDPSS